MAYYLLNGECVSQAAVESMRSNLFSFVMQDADSFVGVEKIARQATATNPQAFEITYRMRNFATNVSEGTKFNTFLLAECTPEEVPMFSEANGLSFAMGALVLFWLGRIAGKQK